ncbi:MAG: CoA ester lyase [Desulfobacterales bacterium]|nr:CoA ester lyase [Desulfobacterales bacterium]
MKPIRTALFAPGNRPDRAAKALSLDADCVILDLEDAVPLSEKEKTRYKVRDVLDQNEGKRIYVRINALTTPFSREDIVSIGSKNLSGIMLPKVESADDLLEYHRLIADMEKASGLPKGRLEIISICETARGLEEIYSIALSHSKTNRDMVIAFGAADYTLDLGIELTPDGSQLQYARVRLPIASRAGGIAPPLDSPWMIDLKDFDGLYTDAKKAKAFGYQGKICIHPNQIKPCHEVFTPTEKEITEAQRIIDAFEEAERNGQAAIQLDGKFIDYPVVERARRTITLSEAIIG